MTSDHLAAEGQAPLKLAITPLTAEILRLLARLDRMTKALEKARQYARALESLFAFHGWPNNEAQARAMIDELDRVLGGKDD